jgi:hypothetical protein
MPAYTIDEQVEIDVNNLHPAPGSPAGLLTNPGQPPDWTTGIVEGVSGSRTREGYERYQVRLTGDTLSGWTANVGSQTLRRPAHQP